ncbi:DM13 domain-containing protein [Shewanella intestini]|uniref:DM13 domain-containing protein n=1 Tax=Shewanella intestini TaxID=2017544 RepID=A0ABS5I6T1_9GAMM|nr:MULTISPECIES: DM13 domain-containing protein [Shewanella]MBR9729085.1 DM13 domain-containing protein [Shewanella intestini]MRG37161.1 hypothetical protein [Shewanella sp. XMDDZSB0408]
MRFSSKILLTLSHFSFAAIGFALGIYALPILSAPPSISDADIAKLSLDSRYTAKFTKDLEDSDLLHWGKGTVSLGDHAITFIGELSPGPDYKVYLSPKFVETESEFKRLKYAMHKVGEVKTFDNFALHSSVPLQLDQYNTVIIWCERFGEFITSAKYR